jgi:NAD(P)-dependent dehydrogenase (short-subunit alcohol dehydrogenase family)
LREPHHRQQHAARPHAFARRRDFVETLAKAAGQSFAQFEKDFFEKVRPTSLIKRFATPEEVGPFVAFVASPLAAAVNGAALRVDGGVVKSAF